LFRSIVNLLEEDSLIINIHGDFFYELGLHQNEVDFSPFFSFLEIERSVSRLNYAVKRSTVAIVDHALDDRKFLKMTEDRLSLDDISNGEYI